VSLLPAVIEHALAAGCVAPELTSLNPVAPVIAREILGLVDLTVN
jgi:hypothetical protein